MSESIDMGPVQVLVVEFDDGRFTGEILPELRRLQEENVVRLVDLLFVQKDDTGDVRSIEVSGLDEEEREKFGAIAGALVGLGAEGVEGVEAGAVAGAMAMEDGMFDETNIWAIADVIPTGASVAIALLEHRWAIPLRDAVVRAGGYALADEWVHPRDLISIGVKMSKEAPA
jgi:uncharacterized membrane protein